MSNIHLHFGWKLVSVDLNTTTATFKRNDSVETTRGDLIIGADGAFSTVRKHLIEKTVVDYNLTYHSHCYKELRIGPKNSSKMIGKHLHIWPRGDFMMIALPNQDESWTVTLFMPERRFTQITDSNELIVFFNEYFPDAIKLIGEEQLILQYFSITPQHLMTVKCSKYHFQSNAVIIGDAAHAMVPFFGQGMNAGFEDCRVLDDLLHNYGYSRSEALEKFSQLRVPNAHAICDLALSNYIEMRDDVNKKSFILRKMIDNCLYRSAPSLWTPLYQSVAFSNLDYRECVSNKEWQDNVLNKSFVVCCFIAMAFIAVFIVDKIV